MTERVYDIALEDRHRQLREIAEAIRISNDKVCHILTYELAKKKPCVRWTPCLPTQASDSEVRIFFTPALFATIRLLFLLRIFLGGRRISSNEEMIIEVEGYFAD